MGGKRAGAGRKPGIPNIIKKSFQDKITNADVALAMRTLRAAMKSDNWKAKIGAATYLLDQKYGKPRQQIEMSGKDGESFKIVIDGREQRD